MLKLSHPLLLGLCRGWLVACSSTPTPNFAATVQAGVVAIQAVQPTPTSSPTSTPLLVPTGTPTLTPTPVPPTASQIFEQISPAVAFIETPGGSGSGLLTPGGYVVTNAHVVWPFEKVRVVFADGSKHLDAPVLGWDLLADLAVIGPLQTAVEPINFSRNEKLTVGSDIYLIGYPGEVKVSSSQPLSPFTDPDHNTTLTPQQTIAGNIDYPGDVDYFVVELKEDQTIRITADSLLVAPLVMVDFLGADEKDFISDDTRRSKNYC